MIKFVNDLRQVGGFFNKTNHRDIADILLKVALNSITLTISPPFFGTFVVVCVIITTRNLMTETYELVFF